MRLGAQLTILKWGLTPDQREGLERICSKDDGLGTLLLLGWDDEAEGMALLDEIVTYCKGCGLPRSFDGTPLGTYGYYRSRVYSDSDIEQSEFVLLRHAKGVDCEAFRDEKGEIVLLKNKLPKNWKMLWHYQGWMLVTDAERKRVEAAGFKAIKFVPASARKSKKVPPHEVFWELTSAVTLPHISNLGQLRILGFSGVPPFDGNFNQQVILEDPVFRTPQFRYKRTELAALGEFDVAFTRERWMSNNPVMVVSNRFMKFYDRKKHRLDLTPVFIDEE